MNNKNFIFELDQLIKKRKEEAPEGAYTTSLFKAGVDRILRKIGEESGELIIASKNNDLEEIKNESADLLFHLLVLLRSHNLSLTDVIEILEKRHQK